MQAAQAVKINNNATSDKELLNNVINGDIDSFDILVDSYKNRLLNFIFRFMKHYDVSEDIVQETF